MNLARIERNVDVNDRRAVRLTLTNRGAAVATHVAETEEVMYAMIDERTKQSGGALISSLRALVADQLAGEAIERRRRAKK